MTIESMIDGLPAQLLDRPRRRVATGMPPNDTSAEEAVLAALLLDEGAMPNIEGLITAEDFFREQNGWIFEACAALWARREAVTIPTVAHELERAGRLDKVGGEPYLAEVAGRYFTAVGVEAHARIIARDSTYRRTIVAASQIAQLAYQGGPDQERVLQLAEELIRGLRVGGASTTESIEAVVERLRNAPGRQIIPTGLSELDAMLGGGLGLGELACFGAHTSHGKTLAAVQIALLMALHGTRVGYVPVEGSAGKVTERMAGIMGGVTRGYADYHGWGPRERDQYDDALDVVAMSSVVFPEFGRVPRTAASLLAWISSAVRAEGLRVVFVDHIDAVTLEKERGESTAGAMRTLLTGLQNLAARENVAIVFLSQVNRGAESMPTLADLRESGAKEELSQLVVMLWMDYSPLGQEAATAENGGSEARYLWARIDKQTEGPVGFVNGREEGSAWLVDFRAMAIRPRGPARSPALTGAPVRRIPDDARPVALFGQED